MDRNGLPLLQCILHYKQTEGGSPKDFNPDWEGRWLSPFGPGEGHDIENILLMVGRLLCTKLVIPSVFFKS